MEPITKEKIKFTTICQRITADTFTPVSVYLNIRDRFPKSILLESSDYHSSENSYSFIGFDVLASFAVKEGQVIKRSVFSGQEIIPLEGKNIAGELTSFLVDIDNGESSTDLPVNGVFGFTAYDTVSFAENIRLCKNADHNIPDMLYHFYRYVLVIHHFKNEAFLFEHVADEEKSRSEEILNLVNSPRKNNFGFSLTGSEEEFTSETEFLQNVKHAKNHCRLGDVFQLVLSRRFKVPFKGDEFNVYRSLRSVNPSPYLFYFDGGDFKLMGSSPEAQLVIKNRKAEIFPIAGTYKRTGNDEEDRILAKQLSADPKENSEHIMLVDLARNDLSRNGHHVSVEKLKEVQYFSHVIHLVSKVTGEMNEDSNAVQMLLDTFPAGTLTGAPKIKAMELISQYENHNRDFYGGAIGFIGKNGELNHAILIRTILSVGNTLHYQAGAGIVESSLPENELQEVNNKLGAVRKAIQNAQNL